VEVGSAEEGGGSPAGSCRIMYTHLWLQATNLRKPTCHRQTNKPTYRSQPTTTPTYSVVVVAGRLACSGAAICPKCWPFMNIAIRIVDTALRGALLVAPGLFVQNGCKCTRIQRLLNSLAKAPVGQVGRGCYQPRALAVHLSSSHLSFSHLSSSHLSSSHLSSSHLSSSTGPSFSPHLHAPTPIIRCLLAFVSPPIVPLYHTPFLRICSPRPQRILGSRTCCGYIPGGAVSIVGLPTSAPACCRRYVACPPVKGELPPSSSPTQCCGIPLYILS